MVAGIVRVISRPSPWSGLKAVWHVVPVDGFALYVSTILGISLLNAFSVPAADIYQVEPSRHEQYVRLASAWSVVFLLTVAASFFAKAGDDFPGSGLAAFMWWD